MSIKLAMFDMDGTLLDSMVYWRSVAWEIMMEKNGRALPEDLQIGSQDPKCEYKTLRYLTQAMAFFIYRKGELHITREEMMEKMLQHYLTDTPVRPGTVELLDRLKAEGVTILVTTATPKAAAAEALRHAGIDGYFSDIITEETYGCGKNDPTYFRELLKKYRVSPNEAVLYEDAYYSMKTAKDMGIYVVGTDDYYARDEKNAILALADEYYTDGWCTRVK